MNDDNYEEAGLSGLVHLASAGLPLRMMFATAADSWRSYSA
jgi:hypothetical protein